MWLKERLHLNLQDLNRKITRGELELILHADSERRKNVLGRRKRTLSKTNRIFSLKMYFRTLLNYRNSTR